MSEEKKEEKMDRRKYIKYVGAGAAVAAAAAIGYSVSELTRPPPPPPPTPTTVVQTVLKTETLPGTTIVRTEERTVVTTASPTPPRVLIRFMCHETDEYTIKALSEAIEAYEKENPHVKISFEPVATGYQWSKIMMEYVAGKAPEIATMAASFDVLSLLDMGILYPITEIVKTYPIESYFPGTLFARDGEQYALPFDVNVGTLFYRRDIFDAYGIKVPETWDELVEAVEKARIDLDRDGKIDLWPVFPGGRGMEGVWEYILGLYWTNGGKIFDDKFNVLLDSPEYLPKMVEALQVVKKLVENSPPGADGWAGWADTISHVKAGKASIFFYHGARPIDALVRANPTIAEKIANVLFPVKKKGDVPHPYGTSDWFVVLKPSVFPEEAVKFLKWFYQSPYWMKFQTSVPLHFVPANLEIAKKPEYLNHPIISKYYHIVETILEAAKTSSDFLIEPGNKVHNPYIAKIRAEMIIPDMFHKYYYGQMSAEDAIKWAASELRKIVGK